MSRIVKLPAGYRQVDYIESTGTQYIDTDYKANQNTRVVMDFHNTGDYSSFTVGTCCLFGARTNTNENAFVMWIGAKSYPQYGSVAYNANGNFTTNINARLIYDFNKNVASIGNNVITCKTATFSTSKSLFLLELNGLNGAANRKVSGKIYSCQIYDNGVLVRDFIPCKTTANVAGLYDLVEGKFYGNAGTGAFLYGAPKKLPQGYRRLTYIESTGTQYIDTGVFANQDTSIELDFEVVSFTQQYSALFGARDTTGGVNAFNCWIESTTPQLIWQYNNGTVNYCTTAGKPTVIGNRMVAKNTKNVMNFGGYSVTCPSSTYSGSHTLYLLGTHTPGYSEQPCAARIYAAKIYSDNDTLVRDFVPCITDSGAIGLYDDLNGVFYENAGSGTFIAGQKIYTEEDIIKVEYIESTGTQYINTGFKANQNTRVRVEAEATTSPTDNSGLFGGRTSATSKAFNFWWRVKNHGARFDYGAYDVDSENILPANTKITVDANKGNCSYGNYSETNTSSAFQCDYSLALFAINTGGTVGNFFVGKIYSCQIYDNGVLFLDYVPCTVDSVFGLWDAISGVLYENNGTGTFVVGGVIVEGLPAPQNLTALISNGVADLQWDAVENALGYKIARNFFPISVTDSTHYADAEAALWGRHEYSVKAYTEEEESDAATIIVFVPGDNPILDLITDRTLADADRIVELSKKDYFTEMTEEERREYRGNPKGAYNAPDLNRVESAVSVLADRLGVLPSELKAYAESLGVAWDRIFDTPYDPAETQLQTKTNWIFTDVPDANNMARYLKNVRTLRSVFDYSTSVLPTIMDELNWKSANAIEEALAKLDAAAAKFVADDKNKMERTAESWYFSGELYSGEV